jgi:hypothetical protein
MTEATPRLGVSVSRTGNRRDGQRTARVERPAAGGNGRSRHRRNVGQPGRLYGQPLSVRRGVGEEVDRYRELLVQQADDGDHHDIRGHRFADRASGPGRRSGPAGMNNS